MAQNETQSAIVIPSEKPSTLTKSKTVLISHGRPPWYGIDGKPLTDAFVIGIGGGSASGKTHVARAILEAMGSIPSVVIVSQDSFYRKNDEERIKLAFANQLDFDHPDAIDMNLFSKCLADLKACKQTNVPVYSFTHHQRLDETQYIYGAAIVIAEGIMALQDPSLRAVYDLKVFVQCDSDIMLARRLRRDVKERGRTVDGVLDQYLRFVKPSYDNFVQPSSRHADIIVPGADNHVAIDLIATHVKRQIAERSARFRDRLAKPEVFLPKLSDADETVEVSCKILNLLVLESTPQVKSIFTTLRDQSTSKEDWIFYADRLSSLLVERGSAELPFQPKTVVTPTELKYDGKELSASWVCGVSLVRSGSVLERGLRRVWQDAPLGTLLIQSDPTSGEPLLLQTLLPMCIRERPSASKTWVFLLDSQIGTAAAAMMAIRTLVDHGVPEDHIIFLTFIVARKGGIRILRKAFPHVRIVCGAVDEGLREMTLAPAEGETVGRKVWQIEPGMGSIGDRYYL